MADEIPIGPITDVPATDVPKPDYKASQDDVASRVRRAVSDRGPRTRKVKEPKPPVAKQRPGYFVKPIEQLYAAAAMGLMIKAPNTATAIMKQAHDCAVAWDALAQKNDAVRRILTSLVQTSDVGILIMAHFPIVVAAMNESGMRNPVLEMFAPTVADEAEAHLREQGGPE
jgi:hypothetical protein